jgi:hypothetical protein
MKYIKGEIYVSYLEGANNDKRIFVWRCTGTPTGYDSYIYAKDHIEDCHSLEFRGKQKNTHGYSETRLPTPEEKHWLEECIRLDRAISYQEALKTYNSSPVYEIY